MRLALTHRPGRGLAAVAAAGLVPLLATGPASAARTAPTASPAIPAPVHRGTLRIAGRPRPGAGTYFFGWP